MFQTPYGRVKAMLNEANLPQHMRIGVWAEAANMALLWENAMVHSKGQLPSYTKLYGKDPPYIHNLLPFGEMGISVNPKFKVIKAKLQNKGQLCKMLGPAENHSKDTFRMLNISTKGHYHSRHIVVK